MNFIEIYKTQNYENEFYENLSIRAGSLIAAML